MKTGAWVLQLGAVMGIGWAIDCVPHTVTLLVLGCLSLLLLETRRSATVGENTTRTWWLRPVRWQKGSTR